MICLVMNLWNGRRLKSVYALRNLLKLKDFSPVKLKDIKGIAYRDNNEIKINLPEKVVPTERMDINLKAFLCMEIGRAHV